MRTLAFALIIGSAAVLPAAAEDVASTERCHLISQDMSALKRCTASAECNVVGVRKICPWPVPPACPLEDPEFNCTRANGSQYVIAKTEIVAGQ